MSRTVTTDVVRDYVLEVRAALDDLPPDELDELTSGLEADLDATISDAAPDLLDRAWLVQRFGSPSEYAAELRAAAGLSVRVEPRGQHGSADRLQNAFGDVKATVVGQHWWPELRRSVRAPHFFWWVFRAGLGAWALQLLLGVSGAGFLVFFVLGIVISLWLGSRAAAGDPLARGLSWVANAAAGVVMVMILSLIWSNSRFSPSSQAPNLFTGEGLWLNGAEVRNILVYDAQGKPLSNVQLFDESGNPLSVGPSAREPISTEDRETTQVPGVSTDGQVLWNVFPLRQRDVGYTNTVDSQGQSLPPLNPSPYLPISPSTARVTTVLVPQATLSPTPGVSASASSGAVGAASPTPAPTSSAPATGSARASVAGTSAATR